ncbi:unknown similar to AMEV173 [Mythimna separata entomopoxvirus 'L']|uniref:Uncharacterized protein n=1 Tax=Mythimna separata entomopoxvirus 'L' TaxID=1293572 RepID=A0A916NYJ5_9POXV|nr:unknown similar to AMEV173 [Mythimna separata entomopoxvirus 'L']CCU56408.1 unknown similar to AMEV173 [Mythimna separata entomopoxvirus 'L']
MYYNNINLLIDLIKINILIPKLYSITKNNDYDVEKHIKYYNKLAKNINKKLLNNLYDKISLDELYNSKYPLILKKVPPCINTKNCYIADDIDKIDTLAEYKYVNGLDSIIYHKINKRSDTILFLIYKNNAMDKKLNGNHIRLINCIDIWKSLSRIDYNIYYKINTFLKKNPSIDYIRAIFSIENNNLLDAETIFLNIQNNIPMNYNFIINILFYRKNNEYIIDDPLIFNSLEKNKNDIINNEIIFIDKKYSIGLYRKYISKECSCYEVINKKNSNCIKLKFKSKTDKKYTILLYDLYLLSYYDIYSNVYIYKNNNGKYTFYSDKLNIKNYEYIINTNDIFVYNFKIYNITSDIMRICIYNNIYENLKIHFKNANIYDDEDLITSISKLKKYDNINVYNIMYALLSRNVKYHMNILSQNININKYNALFDFLTLVYKKSNNLINNI